MKEFETPITIEDLIEKFKSYNTTKEDLALINKAFDYAYKKHFGVKRITGDDYITHPLSVAMILTDINADAECLAAALLHDTVEDTDSTKEEITELFGAEVALLVDGVKVFFSDGSALVRASNTGPNITTRFEATTKERLEEITEEFMQKIETIKDSLL